MHIYFQQLFLSLVYMSSRLDALIINKVINELKLIFLKEVAFMI